MQHAQSLSQSEITAIREADRRISDKALAQSYSVSEYVVWRIRRPDYKPKPYVLRPVGAPAPRFEIRYCRNHIELRIPRAEFLRALMASISGVM